MAERTCPSRSARRAGGAGGSLLGSAPGERRDEVAAANGTPTRRTDRAGRRHHWMVAIHLVDRERGFGGFAEEPLAPG